MSCKYLVPILGVVVLLLAIWPSLLGASVGKWITIVAAVLIVIASWNCDRKCGPVVKVKKK